jgi:hypothetical protein
MAADRGLHVCAQVQLHPVGESLLLGKKKHTSELDNPAHLSSTSRAPSTRHPRAAASRTPQPSPAAGPTRPLLHQPSPVSVVHNPTPTPPPPQPSVAKEAAASTPWDKLPDRHDPRPRPSQSANAASAAVVSSVYAVEPLPTSTRTPSPLAPSVRQSPSPSPEPQCAAAATAAATVASRSAVISLDDHDETTSRSEVSERGFVVEDSDPRAASGASSWTSGSVSSHSEHSHDSTPPLLRHSPPLIHLNFPRAPIQPANLTFARRPHPDGPRDVSSDEQSDSDDVHRLPSNDDPSPTSTTTTAKPTRAYNDGLLDSPPDSLPDDGVVPDADLSEVSVHSDSSHERTTGVWVVPITTTRLTWPVSSHCDKRLQWTLAATGFLLPPSLVSVSGVSVGLNATTEGHTHISPTNG